MSPALADRLVEMGLTDGEAEALLAQDWERPSVRPALPKPPAELGVARAGRSPHGQGRAAPGTWRAGAAEMLLSYFLRMHDHSHAGRGAPGT